MNFVEVGKTATGARINLAYQDLGRGKPVVLIHGWPLSSASWEYQLTELPKHGLRVIAYDRRGFGHSSKTWDGYDYDQFADDLKGLLDVLDLQDVTLVGFSMGGGEVARYMSRHRGERVGRVAFISAVTPFLQKTPDNPEGIDKSVFDDMVAKATKDRFAFLESFGKMFYGAGLLNHPVSEALLQWTFSLAIVASPKATLDCIQAFSATDFRADLKTIKVPTLVIHGDADKTVPPAASGQRMPKAIPHATYSEYGGAPHGLHITHHEQLNKDLIDFSRVL